MDPALYKDFKTARGFTYHYYYHPALDSSKPVLLLLHGFPSRSTDWAGVVEFFSKQGYGLLVPDLLGYGGTDKPTDPDAYRMKYMVKDIVDILDFEKQDKVVVISHDWGSGLSSRLMNYFPDRFLATAFFAVGYFPPAPNFDIDQLNAISIEKNGYAKFGYWKFFAKDGADKILHEHLDSFFTLLYSSDESLKQFWCPEGALESWLLSDRRSSKVLISEEEKRRYIDFFAKNGFVGPFNWYKVMVNKLNQRDDAEIPLDAYVVKRPVFFGGCERDPTSIPSEYIDIVEALCPNNTSKVYDSGHWVLHERPTEVNEDLKKWLDGMKLQVLKKSSL